MGLYRRKYECIIFKSQIGCVQTITCYEPVQADFSVTIILTLFFRSDEIVRGVF
jgi:hypothetical protein